MERKERKGKNENNNNKTKQKKKLFSLERKEREGKIKHWYLRYGVETLGSRSAFINSFFLLIYLFNFHGDKHLNTVSLQKKIGF